VERLEFDLLFRWFVGLGIDDAVFDASVFSRNRNHLLTTDIAREFLSTLLALNLKDGATLSADQGYDAASFVEGLKARKIVPHVAIQGVVSKLGKVRGTAVPPDVAASEGYKISMRKRKRIEEVFGWGKTVGGLAQLKVRGLDKVKAVFLFSLAAYNIVRLPKLLQPRGEMCLEGAK